LAAPADAPPATTLDKGAPSVMDRDEIYLTPGRKVELEEELRVLRMVRRPEITEQIKRAREYGDLSENFEYKSAKQDQAILNGRIAELEAVLDRAKVVENGSEMGAESVVIGSVVLVRDLETEDDWEVTIVDAMSADPMNDRISYSSPVGQALMSHKVGDVVDVTIPAGKAKYEIINIRFG
jgi:transcription elongation factor GreA